MTFSVKSNSFQDGDYLREEHVLSADFGFGCAGVRAPVHPDQPFRLIASSRSD